jgi:hypothetical protein
MGDEYQIGGILGDPPFDDEGDEPMTDADLPSDEELVAVANRAYREVASAGANVSGASRAGRLAVARLAQQRERERGEAKLIAALAPLGVSMMDPPDGGDVSLYEQVERCVAEIARLNDQLAAAVSRVDRFYGVVANHGGLDQGVEVDACEYTRLAFEELDDARRQLAELRGALSKYGDHDRGCWKLRGQRCDCGWERLRSTLTDTKAGGS